LSAAPPHVSIASGGDSGRLLHAALLFAVARTLDDVAALANRSERRCWKIENGVFNLQKNGGFNLEHVYSTSEWQIKDFHILLQIDHLLLQSVERGNLLTQDARGLFGSPANLARRLAESICNALLPAEAVAPILAASIQIRLNTS
jgi:hypothetical protein